MKVLCVAPDEDALAALRRAAVASDWELTAGATDESVALGIVDRERPHAMVVFGSYEGLVRLVRERFPAMRIVADREVRGADAVASSNEEVRGVLRALSSPGGPVRS